MRRARGCVVLLGLLLLSVSAARAEGFFDLYGGAALAVRNPLKVEVNGVQKDGFADFQTTGEVGIRGGYWLTPVPSVGKYLGASLDVSWFDPGGVDVYPISLLAMARFPIDASDEMPNGRLQPYAGVGPGFFVYDVNGGLQDISPSLPDADVGITGVEVGIDVRAGLKAQFNKVVAVFVEYKYTRFDLDVSGSALGVGFGAQTTIETNHVVGGVGFHF